MRVQAKTLSRRGALKTIAVATTGILAPQPVIASTARNLLADTDVCQVMPDVTEGPYYLDETLVRRNLREDRTGVPVLLRLQIVDASCRPMTSARTDVWHCDAQGNYSAFGGAAPPAAKDSKTYLRGTQFTDDAGVAEFETIYPGWYRGRTTHIHYKVFIHETNVLTGQIFFPDALSEYLYEHAVPYKRDAQRDMVNERDDIAQQATRTAFANVKEDAGRYLVQLAIGIDPSAVSRAAYAPVGMGGPSSGADDSHRPPPGFPFGSPPAGGDPTRFGPNDGRQGASLIPGVDEI